MTPRALPVNPENTPHNILNAGFSIIPCKEDKTPDVISWTPYQSKRMTEAECSRLFNKGARIGVIGGAVSGNLECIDFDDPSAYEPFLDLLELRTPGLRDKLTLHEKTPRGGYHVIYRSEGPVAGNTKLAMKPGKDEQGRDTWEVRIETRGEGGYFLAAPSQGYKLLSGSLLECPVLSADEVQTIHETAKAFDLKKPTEQRQTERKEARTRSDGPSPGDQYNQDNDIADILRAHEWRPAQRTTAGVGWTRPGKKDGVSGVLLSKTGNFYVWSSNAHPLEAGQSYSAFALYAAYEHDGNFSAAARALLREKEPDRAKAEEPRHDKPPEDGAAPSSLSSDEILDALDANEDGDATLFIELNQGRFAYDHSGGCWYVFRDHHWHEDITGQAVAALQDVIDLYGMEAKRQAECRLEAEKAGQKEQAGQHETFEEALLKRIRHLQGLKRKMDVLKLAGTDWSAQGRPSLALTGEEWDRHPMLLGCSNGVIDLTSGEHRQGRPTDYIKMFAPTPWLGLDAPATAWERFLQEIFAGNQELIDYIQRLLGYGITGRITELIFPIFHGPHGRNGKGTLLETVRHVLGELAVPIEAEMLLVQKHPRHSGAPTSDIMALRGRRLVWASETGDGRRLDVGKGKWLTGGDTMTGRAPYGKRQVTFPPTHKVILLTNHKPHAPANDDALWARLHLIPFTLSFVDNPTKPNERPRNPSLPEDLKSEAPRILGWLVRGCLEWQKEGLNPPQTVLTATEDYRADEDLIGNFFSDCCVVEKNAEVPAGKLYEAYQKWCTEMGHKPMSGTKFGKDMKDRLDFYDDRRGIFYIGLGLRE